jgi:hypothetical protein
MWENQANLGFFFSTIKKKKDNRQWNKIQREEKKDPKILYSIKLFIYKQQTLSNLKELKKNKNTYTQFLKYY